MEAKVTQNSMATLTNAIHEAAYDGTTNDRRFYGTLMASLNDMRLGKNDEKDKTEETAQARYAEEIRLAQVANKAKSTSVSNPKIAKANIVKTVGNTADKKANASKNKKAATDVKTVDT